MMTLEEIEAMDLHRTAIHEAAHAIVDLRTGGAGGNVYLSRRTAFSDVVETRAWAGQYEGFCIADRTVVGLAGALAAYIHEEGGPDAASEDAVIAEVLDYIETGDIELSGTDAAMAGDYGPDDIERTVRLLFTHWGAIVERAQWEVSKALMA